MYKIIKDNYVIDVSNTYLKENEYNHALVETSASQAHFLLASNETTLYKAPWCYGHVDSNYKAIEVIAEPIDQEEFDALKQELQIGSIEYNETKEDIVTETPVKETTEVLDALAMKRKILELEELVRQLLNK
jgi:hypothetical protein